jgi:hypothetical protein
MSIGERTDPEFGTPREHVETQKQRNHVRRLGCDALQCGACLAALDNTFATFYDASQDHYTQSTRGRPRRTATERWTPRENSSSNGIRRQESRGRIQTPESTKKTQADTCLHAHVSAIFKKLCQKENEKRVRTKAHLNR